MILDKMLKLEENYSEKWEPHEKWIGKVVPLDLEDGTVVIARIEYRVYKPNYDGSRLKKTFTTHNKFSMLAYLQSGYKAHHSFDGCRYGENP